MGKLNLELTTRFAPTWEFGYGKVGAGKASRRFVILIYPVPGSKSHDTALFWIGSGAERFGSGTTVDICLPERHCELLLSVMGIRPSPSIIPTVIMVSHLLLLYCLYEYSCMAGAYLVRSYLSLHPVSAIAFCFAMALIQHTADWSEAP